MTNEEKILSMLDLIASEVKSLKETCATNDELRSFKEQTNHRFDQMDDRFSQIEQNMVTKDEFNTKLADIDTKLDAQNELLEAQIDLLNKRILKQEAQVTLLRKKEAF